MAYFPQVAGRAARGLVCVNHEYVNAELMWPGHRGAGMKLEPRKAWMDKHPNAVAFMQAAHGVSVMQLYRDSTGWTRELSARENRRITARTPMEIHGPARGHELMRTNADPTGTRVLGTFANCSAGKTPWGTYLTSEENVDDYFAGGKTLRETSKDAAMHDAYRRFPLRENSFYGWDHQDPRFDARAEPNEALRFGWMVEIDPHDPKSIPRKRTSLGRFQHEGANTIVGKTGHVAAYMGDDEKFEYIYKFVTRDRFDAKNPAANRDLLDHGTLYCARFDADGTGEWLPLVHDENGPLNSRARFRQPGRRGHQGARRRGLVRRDADGPARGRRAEPGHRPHLHPLHQVRGPRRHRRPTSGSAARPTPASTPRIRGRTTGPATSSRSPRPATTPPRRGSNGTCSCSRAIPSAGRYIVDARELVPGSLAPHRHLFRRLSEPAPSRARFIAPTISASIRRAGSGSSPTPTTAAARTMAASWCRPADRSAGCSSSSRAARTGCEVCGCEFTPDGRTLFLTIQHPGEGGTLDKPRSHWPDGNGLPARAALLAVEREDGAPV